MGRPARREVGLARADIDATTMGEVGSRLEKRATLTIIDSYLLDVVKAQLAKVYLSVLGVAQFHAVIVDADMLRPHGSDIDGLDASHAAIDATGRIPLQKGYHPFALHYFEDYEGEYLGWSWRTPSMSTLDTIPTENLYIN